MSITGSVNSYAFNAELSAKATLKERFVWMLYLGILFFLLYGAANQFSALTAPHPSFIMDWETQLPFIADFILPYMSSDLLFVIAFLMPYSRLQLRLLSLRILLIICLSVLIFCLYPLQFSFQRPETSQYALLFNMLSADLPYNQLPSLHISFAVILYASMYAHIQSRILQLVLLLVIIFIGLSTLLVYQHHFIDIPTGFAMGVLVMILTNTKICSTILHQFSTPRSLKMALYYLLASVIFMLLTLHIHIAFLYVFISVFAVSIVYAFGFNRALSNYMGIRRLLQWLVFAPYFLANTLSWQYYRRKISLSVQFAPTLYFGRQPSRKEYQLLAKQGISQVINLACEQQLIANPIKQTRLAFLDQTIQSPQSLHKAVKLIEQHQEAGVYIHCTLGLSRSVLVVAAWFLYQGKSMSEVHRLLKTLRRDYVKSAYMQVNLELYALYLRSI